MHVLMRVVRCAIRMASIIGIVESFDEQDFAAERDRNRHTLAEHGCIDETTSIPNYDSPNSTAQESFRLCQLPSAIWRHRYSGRSFGALSRRLWSPGQRRDPARRGANYEECVPSQRLLGPLANDQFLAILINCGDHGVEKTFERIRKIVTCAGLRWWSDELPVTTSVGYASVQAEDTVESLLLRAQVSLDRAHKTKITSVLQASPVNS